MLKFRRAESKDCHLIWRWANDAQVRAVSFSSEPIPWEDHVGWFEARLVDPTCIFLIATDDVGTPVGQIRFEIEGNDARISISLDEHQRGQGLGPRLINLASRRIFRELDVDTVVAFIKPGNVASVRAFQKAGFANAGIVRFNQHTAIKMRLGKGAMMFDSSITINGRDIGPGRPVYIIAELSANHNHEFDRAVESIRAAKEAGADAIKLQTYTPDTLTIDCDNRYFQVGSGTIWEGKNLYQLYQEAYTPWEWQPKLKEVANGLGLDLFSTPFDATAVDFLEAMGVPVYKIASFEIVDLPLLRCVAVTGKPVIMSTGMASLAEIDEAVQTLRSAGAEQIALLKCTSAYPAPPEEANLRTIPHLAAAFSTPVGLSDHTIGPAVPVTAVALGACIVEKHFTLSRDVKGPDSPFSMEPGEFKEMVKAVREAEKAIGRVSYENTEHEKPSQLFRRSLFVVQDILRGEAFTAENVRSIRPGYGLHTRHLGDVLGREATRDIPRGTPLHWELIS
jgi:pseudaminic acid synthase